MRPSLGRIVHYRSKTGNYMLAAIITATHESLWPEGVERGDVPTLDGPDHVHLHVFTPGGNGGYQEHNVPLDDELTPRTWRWPTIVREASA